MITLLVLSMKGCRFGRLYTQYGIASSRQIPQRYLTSDKVRRAAASTGQQHVCREIEPLSFPKQTSPQFQQALAAVPKSAHDSEPSQPYALIANLSRLPLLHAPLLPLLIAVSKRTTCLHENWTLTCNSIMAHQPQPRPYLEPEQLSELQNACDSDDTVPLAHLIEALNPRVDDLTPGLWIAIQHNHLNMVRHLLERGVPAGKFAVRRAVEAKSIPALEMLREFGWDDVNMQLDTVALTALQ
jgi:hypothetical protein